MIGVFPEAAYELQRTTIPPGSSLYLFSDGAFEIVAKDGERWTLTDFLPLLQESSASGEPEAERILQSVKRAAGPNPLEDDFSLMVVTFK
jgi:sigma-B regulation protein RsbU (phosphoserine phosphatase)